MFLATSLSENFFATSIASSTVGALTTHWNWKFDCATAFGSLWFFSLMRVCQPARSQCSAESEMPAA